MTPRESHRKFTSFQQKIENKYLQQVLRVLREAVDTFVQSGATAANINTINLSAMYPVLNNMYYQCGYAYGWSVYREYRNVKSVAVEMHTKDVGDEVVTPTGIAEEVMRILRLSLAINVNEMTHSVKQRILFLINKGYEEGWGYEKTARECAGVASRSRALRIVRTESVKASNLSAITGAKKTGLAMNKRWISARDNRVRGNPAGKYPNAAFDHWHVNGQVVPIDDVFLGTGEPMQYPGDPSGAAADVINCRCTCSFIVRRDAQGRPIRIRPGFFSAGVPQTLRII